MNKTCTFLILLIPVLSFSQQKSQINIGVNGAVGWGKIQGLRGHVGVNLGKFIIDGLVVGVSSEFSSSGFNSRKISDQIFFGGMPNSIDFSRNTEIKLAAFSKYYFIKGGFSPFVIAEIGGKFRKQSGAYYQEPKLSNSLVSPHIALGMGVSSQIGKKRRTAIELSYLFENTGKLPAFNYSGPSRVTKPLMGKLNFGLQFFLK
jgi:hypothetical protein